jgi:hypothetical protein
MTASGRFVCFLVLSLIPLAALRAQTYSANAVGYYTVNLHRGYFMIANHLNYKGNQLDEVIPLPEWATGSEFYKFDASTQRYLDTMQWVAGVGWLSTVPNPTLSPGEGGFIRVLNNGVTTPITLTFVGDIPGPRCSLPTRGMLYQGFNQWSLNLGETLASLNPVTGDAIFQFWPEGQSYHDTWQYIEGYGWLGSLGGPEGPRIPVGESFFYQTLQSRSICGWEGPELSFAPLAVPGVTLQNPIRSGATFSFQLPSESGKTYHVQTTDTYPGTWNPSGAPIVGTGETITFTDSTASDAARYYRLRIE